MIKVLHESQNKFFERLVGLKTFLDEGDFYLIGGTALALQVEHRMSEDFDFITKFDIDSDKIIERFSKVFSEIKITQLDTNTLTFTWSDVSVSFFGGVNLPFLDDPVEYGFLKLLDLIDISAMKLRTIQSRATLKDYFDLAFLLESKKISLEGLIRNFYKKYGKAGELFTEQILIKSLNFSEDLLSTSIEILDKKKWGQDYDEIKETTFGIIKQNTQAYLS